MDQALVTALCGAILAGAIFLSHLRRKKNGEQNEPSRPTVKETMREVSEYFGIETQSRDSVSKALDLAPLQMASTLTKQNEPSRIKKSKKRRR